MVPNQGGSPSLFSFHNPTFSVGNAAYRMPTSKSGPWQKLVPIACRLSDHVTMAATMKGAQFGAKKNDIVSWNRPGSHFYRFCCTQPESMISPPTVCVMFLTSSGSHHTWPLTVRLGGGGFVLVVSTFFYFCRGLFDMQHCCTVIMLGLWLSWRLALSVQTPMRKLRCMKSCSHYCSVSSLS